MPNKKITVAIAEDHTLVREGVVGFINDFPECRVSIEAANGRALIEKIAAAAHLPDVVILDISMPELNGYDTIILLKKRYPEMKFLILTMFAEEYSIIKMIKSGANAYLLKSSSPRVLHSAIVSIHTRGYYYNKTASESLFKTAQKTILPDITEREHQFLRLCCSDLSYVQIAELMHISVRTVEGHQKSLSKKLDIPTRIGLVLFAMHTGIASLNIASIYNGNEQHR